MRDIHAKILDPTIAAQVRLWNDDRRMQFEERAAMIQYGSEPEKSQLAAEYYAFELMRRKQS
jgi:hypothetical protein